MYNKDKGSPVLLILQFCLALHIHKSTKTNKKRICPLDKHFHTCAFYISHGMFCSASSFVMDTDVDAAHACMIHQGATNALC